MAEIPPPPARESRFADSVLLIDGDNDPHLPEDFPITPTTLVRVFLRPGAKMPRPLERRLGELPLCVPVVSPAGGANAADFVMSLHAGILHSTLPLHIPFTLVTNDKTLAVIAEELQRVGRQALLWTSHPEKSLRGKPPAQPSRRRRGPRRPTTPAAPLANVPPALAAQPPAAPPPVVLEVPLAPGEPSLSRAAAAYAQRLGRIKDPPSRLKTLLNDIAHRTAASGFAAEAILEELKRSQAVTVDDQGHVRLTGAVAPAQATPAPASRRRRRRR